MNSLVCLFFVSIFTIGTQSFTCNVNVLLSNLNFTLFTRQNQETGVALNADTYSSVDPTVKTIIIIHGWLQDDKKPWVGLMKDTYIVKSPVNIILVNWSAYAGPDYFQDTCAVPYVGSFVGDLIYNLIQVGVDAAQVQIVGFSLGAHVGGFAGQRVFALSNSKVGRIIGLEATKQGYYGKPIDQRLDSSDAVIVLAIHTNNGGYGYPDNYGTIDFIVNAIFSITGFVCGTLQRGCPLNPGVPTDGTSPLPYLFCDHIRAVAYFIESINSDQFLGVSCSSCSNFARGLCNSNPKTIMGEMCPSDQTGVRYLTTNSAAPFAQG